MQNELMARESESIEPFKIYNNRIEELTDELIDREYNNTSIEELKNNKSFFPCLILYLYNNYVGDLLDNKPSDNKRKKIIYPSIEILDNLFNIYVLLVYKYKFNNRPTLIEYGLFTGINHNTINKWIKGDFIDNYNNNTGQLVNTYGNKDNKRVLTISYTDAARKWAQVCESALVDGNGEYVKEIFLLKSCFGYRDTNNEVNITVNHKPLLSAEDLPKLIDLEKQ